MDPYPECSTSKRMATVSPCFVSSSPLPPQSAAHMRYHCFLHECKRTMPAITMLSQTSTRRSGTYNLFPISSMAPAGTISNHTWKVFFTNATWNFTYFSPPCDLENVIHSLLICFFFFKCMARRYRKAVGVTVKSNWHLDLPLFSKNLGHFYYRLLGHCVLSTSCLLNQFLLLIV